MDNKGNQKSNESKKVMKKRNKWDQETIIEKGRKLFSDKGFDLSMRDLAKSLDTQASSLYRHVQSKRELWFAITIKDFEDFSKGMNEIARNHLGKPADLLEKIAYFFLDFARQDFNRFKLMFLYEPPKDNKVGPYEQACNPDSLKYLIQFCDLLIKDEQLTKIKPEELAILYYSQLLGYAIINSPINDYLLDQESFNYLRKTSFDKFMIDTIIQSFTKFK